MPYSATFAHYKPESYLPRFAYFPLFFKPNQEVKTLEDFQLEVDQNGLSSIIRLVDKDGKRVTPFINLKNYDSQTRDWFIFNEDDRLPYRFDGSTSGTIDNMYPSNIGPQSGVIIEETKYDTLTNEVTISGYSDQSPNGFVFYKYAPVVLVRENAPFTDLTDYTNVTSAPGKLSLNSSKLEFYYDFEERLYTNQNLAGIDPSHIKIVYSVIGSNSAVLKCVMGANTGSRPKSTPIVYDYVFKLKGQYLR